MTRSVRGHLTYANVVATLALVIAVGGGVAYAANTVFSSDIVDGEVKTADLADAAVTGAKIAQGTVTGDKVRNDNLTGRDVLDNSLRGADIDESTLSNVGGGGAAGGDLTGTYPNPLIAPNAVGRDEVANDSLRGADIAESTLGQVPDAHKLGGLELAQVSPATGDGRTADLPLQNYAQLVLSTTITTARSATLVATAAVEVTNTQTNTGGATCSVSFDGGDSPDFSTYAVSLRETLPVVWVQGVEAGMHSVELWCWGATYLYVDDAGMSVAAHP